MELSVRRWRQGRLEQGPDRIVVEEPLEIRLAGEPYQVLMRLPGLEKELALGFLHTEGIIRTLAEVTAVHLGDTTADPLQPPRVVDVTLTRKAMNRRSRRHLEAASSPGGLGAKEAVAEIRSTVPRVTSRLTLTPGALIGLMARLPEVQVVFQATGGTHAVALASPDGSIFLSAEDVGRHNAMDKAIGQALLEKRDFGGLVALLSGRLSFEMALKAARAGLPVLAGVSAPTSLAVELARQLNLTLVGFVRGASLNIYTHPQRLEGAGPGLKL
ncbi:MAG: formate dehydrogenase accessory sulfurtransferase FdhD [Desulfobaccales bacterium]